MIPEKNGVYIQRKLGLSHLKYVYIARVLLTAYRVHLIFYDSRRPNVPITTARALRGEYTSMLFSYPFEEKPTVLPLIPLKDFNGALHPAMFFAIDLSGEYGKPENKVNLRREESIQKDKEPRPVFFGSLSEFVTFSDLNSPSNISSLTQRTRNERNRELGTENRMAKLVDVNIDTVEDHVTFIFKTKATTPIYPDDYQFGRVDPNTLEIERNSDKQYELYFRILNFFEWLKGTKPDTKEITQQDVKDVININNVQVFSTSPSYQYQGFNFWMSQLDGSIYPTDIKPQRWDKIHGDGEAFLDKHLYGLVRQIGFFSNPMASMLTKRLKDRELI